MDRWIGEVVADMHLRRITQKRLAEQMGVTNEYVCMILSGKKKIPSDMENRMRDAIKQICGMED